MSITKGPPVEEARARLRDGLRGRQQAVVESTRQRVLVVAGAGSGKTEVMSRRVAWWVAVDGVPRASVVAFTFTEKAAEEMKFRIRRHIQSVTLPGETMTLGGMYVGTLHSFCLKALRDLKPEVYHNFDVLDDGGRLALVQRGYHGILGLSGFQSALGSGQYAAMEDFLEAYDLLNEYGETDVRLPKGHAPQNSKGEAEWCKEAVLKTKVGKGAIPEAFAVCAARYYAYLRCRRFLDFSTCQGELLTQLRRDPAMVERVRERFTHLVVDEVQDINPVQYAIIRSILGDRGRLTAVGDHRQAIFHWRGGRVDLMSELYDELKGSADGEVIELSNNFRSTPRIITVANRWARTIGGVRSMTSPDMEHGRKGRVDRHPTHMAALSFPDRQGEAGWIAEKINTLVHPDNGTGALHDGQDGNRGLTYSDIAVLIRSTTDARTYMTALSALGIPAVVRAGPDLFSQPEVLLFLGVLSRMAGVDQFFGARYNSLPQRIQTVLGCPPTPEAVIQAAAASLRQSGLPMTAAVEKRLLLATALGQARMQGQRIDGEKLKPLRNPKLVEWLRGAGSTRRVFPQALYQLLLAEGEVGNWESVPARGAAAMFHLGQLSSLVTGIETPGWTDPADFKYQIIALCMWGAANARTEEAPLLVAPDAVTISTIHSAKGLEFPVVFLADVNNRRFPSGWATRARSVPFDGPILRRIDPRHLVDNANYDYERRLMYVALTRAERYLFVTCSGTKRRSPFWDTVRSEIDRAGGATSRPPQEVPAGLTFLKSVHRRDVRLVTSFSDLRYYLECPHDFYLRKVLGFSPTIDQAFGYGRGVHNLMREVHSRPEEWARLADDPEALVARVQELIERGLFYLRYTTGEPLERMQNKAKEIVSDYVRLYSDELAKLKFEPELEFETLIEQEQTLVSGAIDVVRLDDPPRVTILDFKSGEAESDAAVRLAEDEMRLQISLYGVAAKRELEYQPDRGLVRYLAETDLQRREVEVALDDRALAQAVNIVTTAAGRIRERQFQVGPQRPPRNQQHANRCPECDFLGFCGMNEAQAYRASRGTARRPSPPRRTA
jgi:DNA helicase-2/ATP-dependent DNA helicase PcrA